MTARLELPLVSIVITSYNYARFIADALESVSLQTYRPLECIVVDDCSTDDSLEVISRTVSELEAKNNGIRYSVVSTEKNSGQLAAFQLGIRKAEGVFINFLDADDFLFPDFISTHIQAHFENAAAFTFSEPVEIDEKNQVHCFHSDTGDAYSILQIPRRAAATVPFVELEQKVENGLVSATILDPENNIISRYHVKWNTWLWYPTSTAVFRRSAVICLTDMQETDCWRICADCLLFCYANIIGNSYFITSSLSAYRRHGKNGFGCDKVVGGYRYLTEKNSSLTDVLYNNHLPLALLRLFSLMGKEHVTDSVVLSKTLIYQQGPCFLLCNWEAVFSSFPLKCGLLMKIKILIKTFIRHFQFKRRKDLLCPR